MSNAVHRALERFPSVPAPGSLHLVAIAAACHVLFFAAFLVTLIGASAAYSATAMPCTGQNLVERLQREQPALLAQARAEADAIENGKSVFWKLTSPSGAVSWLLGTMHSPDSRIARIDGEVEKALRASSAVLVENADALDQAKMAEQMMKLRDLAFLSGTTLEAILPESEIAPLQAAVESRRLPWAVARQMQPWMLSAFISRPLCEIAAAGAGEPALDAVVIAEARAASIEVVNLETIEEQFRAVGAIPEAFHRRALSDMVKMQDLSDDLLETTKQLYLAGDTAMLLPLMRVVSPDTYQGEGYAEFQKLLIGERNRIMATRALPWLEKGGAFIAVGALHLPGSDGLVALLRDRGYTAEPLAR